MTEWLEQLKGTTWVQSTIIGGAAILGFLGFRRFQRRDAEDTARGVYEPLQHALAEHEGRLAEHLARLERLRADLALTEGRLRKAWTAIDEIREGRE